MRSSEPACVCLDIISTHSDSVRCEWPRQSSALSDSTRVKAAVCHVGGTAPLARAPQSV